MADHLVNGLEIDHVYGKCSSQTFR
jgi:hypothetical protein